MKSCTKQPTLLKLESRLEKKVGRKDGQTRRRPGGGGRVGGGGGRARSVARGRKEDEGEDVGSGGCDGCRKRHQGHATLSITAL